VVRHIFQACPVWIYTQGNITSIIFIWVHYTNTEKIMIIRLHWYRRNYILFQRFIFIIFIAKGRGKNKPLGPVVQKLVNFNPGLVLTIG
jgi:hypothetical protein